MSLTITIFNEKLDKKNDAFLSLEDFTLKPKLLSQVVRAELSNVRVSRAHAKIRSEVSGGGKKPWKQKGTGRARHGSSRSPIWVGGGTTHGPRNVRNWHLKINKSARISSLKTILKDRLIDNSVFELAKGFDFPKTSQSIELLQNLEKKTGNKIKQTILLYTSAEKPNLRGFVNAGIFLLNASNIKIYKIVAHKNVVLTAGARELLEERVSK
jgi:large subunit ribosomal protein L4